MSDLDPIYDAIRKADAAGDAESVKKLGAYLKTQSAGPEEKVQPWKPTAEQLQRGEEYWKTHTRPKPTDTSYSEADKWKADSEGLRGALRSEVHGVVDPLVGIGQAVAHVVGAGDQADKFVQNREKTIQAERSGSTGVDGFRMMGNAMSPTNYLVPGGVGGNALAKLATAAGAGAATAAMNPVTSGNYWAEKGKQVGEGGLAGGALGVVGQGLSKAAAPVAKSIKELMDAGITLTPGQMAGGVARRAEEAAKSVPVLGNAIRKAEGRAIGDFNTATVNKALEPIGATVPKGTPVGHETIAAGQRTLSDAYDTLLPKLNFGIDQGFAQDIGQIRTAATEMPEAQAKQLESIINNRVGTRLKPNGTMDGATMKQVQGELSMMSRNYKSSADAAQRDLGHAIDDVNSAIRDGLERQNPVHAPELRKINEAYAMFTRVENAASRRATSEGVFTPGDLLQAIKTQDKSTRKRAFAAGDGLMQDWAEKAHQVLGNKLPDSGTTERALHAGGLGLGYLAASHPLGAAAALGALAPYSRPGMNLLREFASAMPTTRNHLAQMSGRLPQLAPAAGAIVPPLAGPNQ